MTIKSATFDYAPHHIHEPLWKVLGLEENSHLTPAVQRIQDDVFRIFTKLKDHETRPFTVILVQMDRVLFKIADVYKKYGFLNNFIFQGFLTCTCSFDTDDYEAYKMEVSSIKSKIENKFPEMIQASNFSQETKLNVMGSFDSIKFFFGDVVTCADKVVTLLKTPPSPDY